ncbi:unnamed protein product [Paramecium sonneborni]|uniref:Uncharacterized protein n=1 Tax=Paramecium sonneborni TaxID=65129 RepID=A0A8S1PT35_9CILI|nr:unnamed protein product [Paramecium sonneborni]
MIIQQLFHKQRQKSYLRFEFQSKQQLKSNQLIYQHQKIQIQFSQIKKDYTQYEFRIFHHVQNMKSVPYQSKKKSTLSMCLHTYNDQIVSYDGQIEIRINQNLLEYHLKQQDQKFQIIVLLLLE